MPRQRGWVMPSMSGLRQGYRVSVDTGGTFTDVVVGDERQIISIGKALTTANRISEGIFSALEVAAQPLQLTVNSLLGATSLFIYGSTHATNAILERKTARTALLVTQGFPDILVRREGGKLNPWDFSQPYPDPYIPRRLTVEIRERVTAEGAVVTPIDRAQATRAVRMLKEEGIQAVAVCFLWSIVNASHELAVAEILNQELPGVPWSLSHLVNPIIREYRRASSTAIDASLKPLMQSHLRRMESDLRAAGFGGELLPATSFGGVLHIDDVVDRPIHMVRSGPALAPVLGRELGRAETQLTEVIVCDAGGTSFDVSLVRNGRPVFSRETWLGGRFVGDITGLSSVDARSIGAGGGSIARVDSAGLLRVGPESAGADPGPACYGRGGRHATVTDAALVLGYLDPAFFLAGRMPLDVAAAQRAIEPVADALRQPTMETAAGIVAIAGELMVGAIQEMTINEGIDPRDSLLLAGGGAAGLNIVPIARELGCRHVLIPRMAGALSACGAQYCDIVTEVSANLPTRSRSFSFEQVNATLTGLTLRLSEFERAVLARGAGPCHIDYFVEARYVHQVWELEVPLRSREFDSQQHVDALIEDFHAVHETTFAVKEIGQEVELIQWKARLTAELAKPQLRSDTKKDTREPKPIPAKRADAFFRECGVIETAVYTGDRLSVGAVVHGPALILEPTTTIVLYPGSSAAVSELGNYMLSTGVG
jgi:N-methylhydantoinase A